MTADQPQPGQRRHRWGLGLVGAAAAIAVAVGTVVAVRGLLANPVRSTDRSGITTIQGGFFPYDCGQGHGCRGYVQAGGRSVFVVLPDRCGAPQPQSEIVVRARRSPDLGSGAYIAVGCPSPA